MEIVSLSYGLDYKMFKGNVATIVTEGQQFPQPLKHLRMAT
jgi:hypothetical protein